MVLILIATSVVWMSNPARSAEIDLPDAELQAANFKGNPEIKKPTTDWRTVDTGTNIDEGDRIRTDSGETIAMVLPGVSVTQLEENADVMIENLKTDTDIRGGLSERETVGVTEIKIDSLKGKILNHLKDRENIRTDYEIETPNATIGVRGTSFHCDFAPKLFTECAVLDGKIRFASTDHPDQGRIVGAQKRSILRFGSRRPTKPSTIRSSTQKRMKSWSSQARTMTRKPPDVQSLQLNGNAFNQNITLQAPSGQNSIEVTLSGTVVPGTDKHEIQSVNLLLNGNPVSVRGTRNWQTELSLNLPDTGGVKQHEISVRARDNQGLRSREKTATITIDNQKQQTERTGEGLPPNLSDGNVQVSIAEINHTSYGKLEFPYQVYRSDLDRGGLKIRGSARGDATISGVAYSTNGGNSWTPVDVNGNNWMVMIPLESEGEYDISIVAWTQKGIIGEARDLGTVVYEDQPYERSLRTTLRNFYRAYENEDADRVVSYFSDFRNAEQIKRGLETFFDQVNGLIADVTFNSVFSNPGGGQVDLDVVITGSSQTLNRDFVFLIQGLAKFIRDATGSFQVSQRPSGKVLYFTFDETITSPYTYLPGNTIFSETGGTLTPSEVSFIGVSNSQDIFVGDNTRIQSGGIAELSASDISEVSSVPSPGHGNYSDSVPLKKNTVYSIQLETKSESLSQDSNWRSGLMAVGNRLDSKIYRYDLIGTTSTEGPLLNWNKAVREAERLP